MCGKPPVESLSVRILYIGELYQVLWPSMDFLLHTSLQMKGSSDFPPLV